MTETFERSFNVGILGENQDLNTLIGQIFGAPGIRSDLQFFNRLDTSLNHIFCAVTPLGYPEKIKPLLQTLTIADIYVLVIDLNFGLNAVIGELLIAMDLFNQIYNKRVLITFNHIHENQWKLEQELKKLRSILKTTSLAKSEILKLRAKSDYERLKKRVIELAKSQLDQEKDIKMPNYTKLLIDHIFPVKGIGTVALAVVKKGILKKGQMVELVGNGGISKKIVIKNIQKQDRNFDIAYKNDRIGLVLKGIKPNEVNREFIMVTPKTLKSEKNVKANVVINKFYSPKEGKIIPGNDRQYYAMVDLKFSPFKFSKGEKIIPGGSGAMMMDLSKELYHDGSGLMGIITDLNKFENKNRIVGVFTQNN